MVVTKLGYLLSTLVRKSSFLIACCLVPHVHAATLAPDAVDVLYHSYEGGGMEINGPSVLVRKSIGSQVSVSGQYYVDSISAASVDVIALASEYEEERTEITGGVDYLYEKTIVSGGYTNSSENDYEADTVFFSVTQDFFGDMTSLTLGYAYGEDEIGTRGLPRSQWEDAERQNYKIGVSQVLTKNSLLGVNLDVITDEGFLENPYRRNRFVVDTAVNPRGFEYQVEDYPDTRTSTALGILGLYYLPYRASIKADYRYFGDSWDIQSHTVGFEYAQNIKENWILEGRIRYYTQDQAEFYSDLFPFANSQTHTARDKELSSYSGFTFGFGASYEIKQGVLPFVKRLHAGFLADYLAYDYDNFRDVTASGFAVGEEPLYELRAWVIRASLIVEY